MKVGEFWKPGGQTWLSVTCRDCGKSKEVFIVKIGTENLFDDVFFCFACKSKFDKEEREIN